jgi:hypothetical protein
MGELFPSRTKDRRLRQARWLPVSLSGSSGMDAERVLIGWRERPNHPSDGRGLPRHAALPTGEFLRRFLQHFLPSGFSRPDFASRCAPGRSTAEAISNRLLAPALTSSFPR